MVNPFLHDRHRLILSFPAVLRHVHMQRHGLPANGPLFKSVSGELSNLRWDLPVKEMPSYWEKENRCARTAGNEPAMAMSVPYDTDSGRH